MSDPVPPIMALQVAERFLLGSMLEVKSKFEVDCATLSLVQVREYSKDGSHLMEQTLDIKPEDMTDRQAWGLFVEVGGGPMPL